MKKKILFVFGTRPEAIKIAPIIAEAERRDGLRVLTCVFRQHRGMLDEQLRTFGIRPSFDIPMPFGDRGVMRKGNPFMRLWSLGLVGIGVLRFVRVLRRERPDLLVVVGDTSTVFLSSFIAYHMKVRIAHVEAGLRTYNKYAPFPEEANRRFLAGLADLHFAPTDQAKENLISEHVDPAAVFVTGNTVLDALRITTEKQQEEGEERSRKKLLARGIPYDETRKLVLVTAHRRESFGEGLRRIAAALRTIAERQPEALIIYPVHANPNVRDVMEKEMQGVPNVVLAAPIEHELFVFLLRHAHIVLTDSGGIQEEVSLLGTPTLVMREVTERPEGIAAGNARLVGTDPERIVDEAIRLLNDPDYYASMQKPHTAFGDGHAAERIVNAMAEWRG